MKQLGPITQKILLLLEAGLILSLTRRPDQYFRIVRKAAREWQKINERNLRRAIKRLYQSKLLNCHENKDGTTTLILTNEGKQKVLKYHIQKIAIKAPNHWDGLWRVVLFDIPEREKKGRDALAAKLKELGFYSFQKSVFVHPYECKDEIDFVVELYKLTPFVRFMRVRDIDIALDLKRHFKLK